MVAAQVPHGQVPFMSASSSEVAPGRGLPVSLVPAIVRTDRVPHIHFKYSALGGVCILQRSAGVPAAPKQPSLSTYSDTSANRYNAHPHGQGGTRTGRNPHEQCP